MRLPDPAPSCIAPGIIASRVAVVVGVLMCVVALIVLTPSRSQLFKRHLLDGDERAAGLMVAEKRDGYLNETTIGITAETIRVCEREGWNRSSLALLTSYLGKTRNFNTAAGETLRQADRMPAAARIEVMSALVARALADGDLPHAQELQMQLVESAEVLTPEITRQAVKTYRYNSNPALALLTIDTLEEQRGSLPEDLRELRVVLYGETSQPAIAFAHLTQRIRATDEPATLRKLIPDAIRTGIEAGRQNDLIPLYEKYLAVVKAGRGSADPRVAEYSMNLAQTYEWTKEPSKAFDVYLELASRGNRRALDRCLALNPGLFRQEDVMNALVAGYDHYRNDDELLLLTARYLGEAALRAEAIRCYLEYLDRNPNDAEAHYRLGSVYDEDVQFENSLAHFKRAHELAPANNAFLSKAASLATTLRKYDEALGYLRVLSTRTRDRDHVEQFYTLADGIGDLEATKEALRLLIATGGRLAASNYIYLAAAYREEGDLAGHLQTLKEALEKFPAHPFIRIELANAYLYGKRPDLGLAVLKDVKIAEYPQGAQVALNSLLSLARTPYAGQAGTHLDHFGGQLEASDSLTAVEVLQFAEFCLSHGAGSRARRLFRRVPGTTSEPGILARAYFHLEEYQPARRCQLAHLAKFEGTTVLTSDDYQLLGDIHTKLGESRSARSAYQTALALLQKRTAKPPQP